MGLINNTPPSLSSLGTFGCGVDGDVVLSGNASLNRDMYYNNLTINSGVTLTVESYRLFVRDTLLNYGTIDTPGMDGYPGTGTLGGNGGSAQDQHVLPVGQEGGNGGNSSSVSPNVSNIYHTLGGLGGKGGFFNYASGSVQTFDPYTTIDARPFDIVTAGLMGFYLEGSFIMFNVGHGGSGGGGGSGSGGGGGGGAGGNLIFISARTLRNYGIIEAPGGNGGNGYPFPAFETCGGGGGGGGCIILLYNNLVEGTISVAGGTGGIGYPSDEYCNGANGSPGNIIKIDNYL